MQQICKMTEEHNRINSLTNNVVGGENPFQFIIDPETRKRVSVFSKEGKRILKELIGKYEQFMQKIKK